MKFNEVEIVNIRFDLVRKANSLGINDDLTCHKGLILVIEVSKEKVVEHQMILML